SPGAAARAGGRPWPPTIAASATTRIPKAIGGIRVIRLDTITRAGVAIMDPITVTGARTAHKERVSAVLALVGALLVAAGSCIRGELRFVAGLPVTVAGLAAAARAMVLVDDERRVPWLAPVSALLIVTIIVGLFGPRLPGAWWYDALC